MVRRWLVVLVGLGLVGSAASVALAFSISNFIAETAAGKVFSVSLVPLFLTGAATKVAVSYFQELYATKVSVEVKMQLRKELLAQEFVRGDVSPSELVILATRGLDALDAYFGKFLPQFVYAILVTPITVAVFFLVDPLSSIILVFTIPLIPLFMVFIGRATQAEQERQFDSLTRLGKHFHEVVRGLATLKLFNRTDYQSKVLGDVSENLRARTMKVLRISFLSGFALELAASLSVALLAVTIGFRLLEGQIAFFVAMFLLMMAPDAYLPIRTIGANYHASSEGIAAASRILDLLESNPSDALPARLPAAGFEVWIGPSGSGKTRKMEQLAFGPEMEAVAWMPQEATLLAGSVRSNIVGDSLDSESLGWATRMAALDDVSLEIEIDDYGRGLSGGQAQRVSLARALYRLKSHSLGVLLLDEPTSSIDMERSTAIWNNLREIAGSGVAVSVITHQIELIQPSDRVVNV
ncbi:MAG: transporter, ATP-binding protein [Actinomycetota bacterium]